MGTTNYDERKMRQPFIPLDKKYLMTFHQRLVVMACVMLMPGIVFGQDDIFGVGPTAGNAPTRNAASTDPSADDPLVRQLLEHATRGDLPLADAIAQLARIGRWSDVDRLLARTAGKNLDDPTLAEMFRLIGPTVYMRIKQRTDLSDSAKAGIEKLQVGATQYAESASRLQEAIEQLGSDSDDEQLAGTRTLMSGGNASVEALVAAAVTKQPPAKRDRILRTVLALGGGGVEALSQLALYGTPEVRTEALASLARISRRQHIAQLVTALYAADATPTEKQVAQTSLARLGEVPSREAAIEALAYDLRRKHEIAEQIKNDGQIVTLWSVNEDLKGVSHQPALQLHATYRDVYDAAARLQRIGGLPPELETATLAVVMGYHLLVDPDWGDLAQLKPIRDQYDDYTDGAAISTVIDYALASDDHAATIGLIRLIDPEKMSDEDRFALLEGNAGVAAPLVRAALSPEPRVRYEAALKIAALAGDRHYAGSSQVKRTLSEMVSLADKPTVLLVETRPEVILRIETIASDLGLRVKVASTVRQLQRYIAEGGDLRLVLAKRNLADQSPLEMVDSVRRMNRGRQLAIAVYGDQVPFLEDARWNAPTTAIEGDVSLNSVDELFDLVKRSRRMPPLTIIDRQGYREAARTALGI